MAVEHPRVANAPDKPLMLFDGTCHFCRRWIERWREATADRIDYEPLQEHSGRFPEVPREEFERAVKLIETDGRVFSGAAAVFQSLSYARRGDWLKWLYDRAPGVAPVTETAYAIVAKHRQLASAATRLLWGDDVRRSTYFIARRSFLRAVGIIYFIAFVSLWVQVDGLIGSDGILPVGDYLAAAKEQLGSRAFLLLPTLSWLNSSNAFLHFLCGAGAFISLLLIAGVAPVLSLAALFVFYLSLTVAGQTFLSFQWDILLLETGFLAIFFAPLQWWPKRDTEAPVPRVGLFLLKLLLFKLMLMSGIVKLTSGDDSWWNLTALDYHYWTQPLPTVLGWWADQHPEWLKKLSVAFTLAVEVIVPFFIWAPRRLRLIACALLVLLQVGIALTGNYAFFNLLTAALCLLLIDDVAWRFRRKAGRQSVERSGPAFGSTESRSTGLRVFAWIPAAFAGLLVPMNAWLIFSAFKPEASPPRIVAALDDLVQPFHIANGYGLFRVMTKTRPEIVIEGSSDAVDWKPYAFKWKPGDLSRAPRWVEPHQPRLDWQMWFAALGDYRRNRWFVQLLVQLLQNSPAVTRLLEGNPFPQAPPRYIRATLYQYRFATAAEHRATGAWWTRDEQGPYCPVVSLHEQ
jgi:predicted DCC family thiol-disulfide oxidoreductase YuxK